MATAGVGEGAVGLTMPAFVVAVCPTTLREVVTTPETLAGVVAVACCWVVAGMKTEDVEETVFITELTLLDWLDITILD